MCYDEWNNAYQVKKKLYCSSPFHWLIGLNDSPNNVSLENIGKKGENLTIAILSMNRSNLTKRLMDSISKQIPDFQGIFMILDNGSETEEITKLQSYIKEASFRCQLELQEQNLGVAGGRNCIMQKAKTDWVFCLDNDMVFLGNPIPQAQEDIATLGVHFLSVPFINGNNLHSGVMGGNLFVKTIEGRINIGLGTVFLPKEFQLNKFVPGFLCTGIFGGSSIINKHTFEKLGGYEGNMFVGFEDIEFSMRVFQSGFKVGSMGMICLSHDHISSKNDADFNYEKERFYKQRLFESAKYFEKKHGVGVWNKSSENWINNRRYELNIENLNTKSTRECPRIALIIDSPDWALDHIADQIIRYCSDDFDFIRYYSTDIDNIADLLIAAQDCDVIHFFWRGLINWYYDEYAQGRIKAFGYSEEDFRNNFITNKTITTSIYDHLYLKEGERAITEKLFASADSIVDAYTVSSQRLKDIYDQIPNLRMRPAALVTDGVDTERFKPENLERLDTVSNRKVIFGWVGNSNWNWADEDLKGLHTIIQPAIKQLQDDGYNIELVTSDRDKKMIPHSQMPHFYGKIDCYLCASLHEGTPNPVLESMACGVPVISTDVGLIPQLFGEKQKEFVLRERSVDEMVRAIKKLLDQPMKFRELSSENHESIKAWDWSICARRFISFWKEQLEIHYLMSEGNRNE